MARLFLFRDKDPHSPILIMPPGAAMIQYYHNTWQVGDGQYWRIPIDLCEAVFGLVPDCEMFLRMDLHGCGWQATVAGFDTTMEEL